MAWFLCYIESEGVYLTKAHIKISFFCFYLWFSYW